MSSKTIADYDLVIFDCDGTLVDSEYLNNKVNSDLLIEFGLTEYTPERCIQDFSGVAWSHIKQMLEERHRVEIPRSLVDRYMQFVDEQMETLLKPVEGAYDFAHSCAQQAQTCVASNGMRENVVRSLDLQNFLTIFAQETIFTKIQVENPKPAPDLFLFAAEKMNVTPERCLVIEDSTTGVRAGVAAGMDVLGFTGVSHEPLIQEKKLFEMGASGVFNDIIHMRDYLGL